MKDTPEAKAQQSLLARRLIWGGLVAVLLVLLALRTTNGPVLPVRALTATPLTCGNTNIAPGKPITARSSENSTLTPGKAIDGNLTTRWSSQFSDPQWIQIDLGSTQVICRVVLRWEAAYAKTYQIQLSNDGTTWTTSYSTISGDGGVDDITGLRGSGRYLRIYMTQRATPYGYSLYEIEIYPAIWPTVTPPTSTRPCGGVVTATPSPTASPTRTNTVPPGTADDVVRTPTTCRPIVVTNTATTALPDLRVTRMYAELGRSDPTRPCEYPHFGIRVEVINSGSANAGPFVIDLDGMRVAVPNGLAAGATASAWFDLPFQSARTATVDAALQVAESDETNNSLTASPPSGTATRTGSPRPPLCTQTPTRTATQTSTANPGNLPDLQGRLVSNTTYGSPDGCTLGVAIEVSNTGIADAGPFVVRLTDSSGAVSLMNVAGLAAGQRLSLWRAGSASSATLVVDVHNTVVESNESNNTSSAQLPLPSMPTSCLTRTPTSSPTQTRTPTRTQVPITLTVSPSKVNVSTGETITVYAHTNMGIPRYTLRIIDLATGLEQSETAPIFDPARPPALSTGSGGVTWTLRALRAGSVRFDVFVSGEIYMASCNCFTMSSTSGSSGTVQVFPEVLPSACSGAPLYVIGGGTLCKTPGGGATTNSVPSAGGANRDGTPTNPLVYTLVGAGNMRASTTATFQLYVDAGSAVGNGVQAQLLYDYTGDGTWDRTETYNYFATDPVAGWQLYDQSRGLKSSSGAFGTFMNGRVQLRVWSAIGNAPTLLRVSATSAEGRQSLITVQ